MSAINVSIKVSSIYLLATYEKLMVLAYHLLNQEMVSTFISIANSYFSSYRQTLTSVGYATVKLVSFKPHANVATCSAQSTVTLKRTTAHSTTINSRKPCLRRITHR